MEKHVNHANDVKVNDDICAEQITARVRRKQTFECGIVGITEHRTDRELSRVLCARSRVILQYIVKTFWWF